jgi:hypothetical protein
MVPLTDSDEFFMLELGEDDQEEDLLRSGPAKLNDMARRLRQWTTKEHRESATFDFVFHSGSLPQNLSRVSKDASSFIERLHALMGDRPINHVNHHYWVRGLQHWLRAKATTSAVQFPPELASGQLEKWLTPYTRWITWLQGVPPEVPVRAYDWNDYQLVRRWLLSLGEVPKKSVLFVCPEDSRLRGWLATDPRVEIFEMLGQRIPSQKISKRYQFILLHADVNFLRSPAHVLKSLLTQRARGGEIAIYFGGLRSRPHRINLHPSVTTLIRNFMWRHSSELTWDEVSVNGRLQGLMGAVLFKVSDVSFDDFLKGRPRWAPIGIVASLILTSAIATLNMCLVDRLALRLSNHRSATLLRGRGLDETQTVTTSENDR